MNFANIHKNEKIFILGNGPSLNQTDMSLLKDRITIGSNRVYLGFPQWGFRLKYWGIEDTRVGEDTKEEWNEQKFDMKFVPLDMIQWVTNHKNVVPINFRRTSFSAAYPPKFSFDPKVFWWGSTVTYLLLQISCVMGASKIVLVGVDHKYLRLTTQKTEGMSYRLISNGDDPDHFHPQYFGKGRKFHTPRLDRCEIAYRVAERETKKRGIKILNATVDTHLHIFEKVKLEDVI